MSIPPELQCVLTRHGLTCDEKVNVYRAEYDTQSYSVTLDLRELADVILGLENEAIAAVREADFAWHHERMP